MAYELQKSTRKKKVSVKMGEKGKEQVKSLQEKDSCCFEVSWEVQEITHTHTFSDQLQIKKVPEIIKGS